MQVIITQIDTACMLIDINGFRIVTDPTFDAAGGTYQSGSGRILKKTGSPAIRPEALGQVDLVLLSHDQHKDNLDDSGRAFLQTAPRVISTKEARERLGLATVTGIDEWETVRIETDKVPGLLITGTPCMHGSDEELHRIAGHVLGFILEWDGQQNGVLYISGDTVFFEGVEEVAERYAVDTAILHIGRAGFPAQIGDRYLTFTTEEAIRTAKLMKVNKLVPTHQEGWEHFLEDRAASREQIIAAGLGERLVWLTAGRPEKLEI
ncbi:MBL fold metallo-hydrolase [Flavitalea sp. BT771]|uniref:MBL fold metallo-hydrolase n=1 Tax=Flavitalea sp. BT771 TaxID=3063329 RepID=UPI0026E25A02|nr:MBL fold metallo-hydrolase [Flavitalea sp. BT771]MDO6435335.1 MBL fold metallo-hydrolase [Flavitalea sp. BT771]MDV6224305.1 MBL fold metallo-hydrolase [Flavitalea sp. BT771]